MDDAELIAATARGEADAFAALCRRRLPPAWSGFALRATADPEVAADLTAEVFARRWRRAAATSAGMRPPLRGSWASPRTSCARPGG
jgi:DNA-directed RNA polymerase specialized sigma24 family protein